MYPFNLAFDNLSKISVGILFILKDKFFLGLFNQGFHIVKKLVNKITLKLKKS